MSDKIEPLNENDDLSLEAAFTALDEWMDRNTGDDDEEGEAEE